MATDDVATRHQLLRATWLPRSLEKRAPSFTPSGMHAEHVHVPQKLLFVLVGAPM
jgi:hypothetical protein